jgi:hypothetical protein
VVNVVPTTTLNAAFERRRTSRAPLNVAVKRRMPRVRGTWIAALALCLPAATLMAQPENELRGVAVKREEAWIAVQFPLLQQKDLELADKSNGLALEFGGLLGGAPVSMYALIDMLWEEQKQAGVPFSFWWSELVFERNGSASDNLVRALASLYNVDGASRRSKDQVMVKAVSIASKPEPSQKAWRLKLFFGSTGATDYAEAYLNIDFEGRTVSFAEKDTEYRRAIIDALITNE